LSGLQRLRRLIVIRARGPTLFEESVLAVEMILRLSQLPLGSREIGLRRPQRVHLVLRFETRHDLPGLHPISELAAVFEEPTRDAEGERI
jgi:hypothetical protein